MMPLIQLIGGLAAVAVIVGLLFYGWVWIEQSTNARQARLKYEIQRLRRESEKQGLKQIQTRGSSGRRE